MIQSQNRRNHFRADILIPVRWQIMNNFEIQQITDGLGHHLFKREILPTPIDEFLAQAIPDSQEEQLFRSLQYINNKLDFLIEQVLSKSIENSIFSDRIIELSASGIKFSTPKTIPVGTYLKMNVILPGTLQYRIDFASQVMRVEQKDSDYVIAANIVYIDREAQESIIKIVFQKQRMEIRKKKKDEEIIHVD